MLHGGASGSEKKTNQKALPSLTKQLQMYELSNLLRQPINFELYDRSFQFIDEKIESKYINLQSLNDDDVNNVTIY